MRGRERIRKLLQAGGLPEDALLSSARVTMNGRTSVTIEGQRGVVELSQSQIRLATGNGMLCIRGCALTLMELTPALAVVTGEPVAAAVYD
ncbi:MAG: YabP/YqfC family sporulation protein [Clostridia bacterium]|nr:YabP/YqfC family sporulation protein [Clostridia bacterium]